MPYTPKLTIFAVIKVGSPWLGGPLLVKATAQAGKNKRIRNSEGAQDSLFFMQFLLLIKQFFLK
jgi:hypothetical protein